MSCRELVEFLSEYVEGRLPMRQRLIFVSHLAMCKACRTYLDTFQTTLKLAKASGKPEPQDEAECSQMPDELIQAIQAARKAQAD